MLAPVNITLSQMVLKTKNDTSLVSTSYIAQFEDGSQKSLNMKEWVKTNLNPNYKTVSNEPIETVLDKSTCTLYWRDWSNNPILGDFNKNYPTITLVPKL